MQLKLNPETVAWWSGPNQETEASTYFLHFVLFFECTDITSLEICYFYCRDNSKIDSLFCCFMQNSRFIKLRCVLDIESVLFR